MSLGEAVAISRSGRVRRQLVLVSIHCSSAVAQYFDNVFANPITVNITVGYGKIQGQNLISGALGESQTEFNQYSTRRSGAP